MLILEFQSHLVLVRTIVVLLSTLIEHRVSLGDLESRVLMRVENGRVASEQVLINVIGFSQ